ncbi:MAG: hypothetical protein ACTSR3_09395 [Candidatus Helarchaeota archaeon]
MEVLKKIKDELGPILKHSAVLYADGNILQSTFPEDVNIRGIGDNLAEAINHLNKIIELLKCENTEFSNELIYRTPIYYILAIRTQAVVVLFILDLAQDKSEIYRTWEVHNVYKTISQYLDEIKRLADWDKSEFEIEELKKESEKVEKEFKKLRHDSAKLIEIDLEIRKEKKKIREEKKELRNIEKILPEEEMGRLKKEKEKLKKKDEKIKKKEIKIIEKTEKLQKKREEIEQKKEELNEKEKELIRKKEKIEEKTENS